jgi:hypothetical protein
LARDFPIAINPPKPWRPPMLRPAQYQIMKKTMIGKIQDSRL